MFLLIFLLCIVWSDSRCPWSFLEGTESSTPQKPAQGPRGSSDPQFLYPDLLVEEEQVDAGFKPKTLPLPSYFHPSESSYRQGSHSPRSHCSFQLCSRLWVPQCLHPTFSYIPFSGPPGPLLSATVCVSGSPRTCEVSPIHHSICKARAGVLDQGLNRLREKAYRCISHPPFPALLFPTPDPTELQVDTEYSPIAPNISEPGLPQPAPLAARHPPGRDRGLGPWMDLSTSAHWLALPCLPFGTKPGTSSVHALLHTSLPTQLWWAFHVDHEVPLPIKGLHGTLL